LVEKCPVNNCEQVEELKKIIVGQEKKAEEGREHYREKQDRMLECVEKLDRTIHGEPDTANKGMMKIVEEMQEVHYIPKFLHDTWTAVKVPILIFLITGFLSFVTWEIGRYVALRGIHG